MRINGTRRRIAVELNTETPAEKKAAAPQAWADRSLEVSAKNYQLLRRLDQNADGTITSVELEAASRLAGRTRITNEGRGLTEDELAMVKRTLDEGGELALGHTGQRIGAGVTWQSVQAELFRDAAEQRAPLGSVGQGRPGAIANGDCGPAAALFTHDRRQNEAPMRTHAEADALIEAMSQGGGTLPAEMKDIMNEHLRHAGGRYYTFEAKEVGANTLEAELRAALLRDRGGVLVNIVSTYNAGDRTGTGHWLAVTKLEHGRVSYYEPGGPDGADHLHEMSIDELRGSLSGNVLSPTAIVFGTSSPEAEAKGELEVGERIGELEVRFSNRDLSISSTGGVYGSQKDARAAAIGLAEASGEDAIVRKEGSSWAVYGITEIRAQFGGLWSDNTLAELDAKITDVYMTDPVEEHVRRARSGPSE